LRNGNPYGRVTDANGILSIRHDLDGATSRPGPRGPRASLAMVDRLRNMKDYGETTIRVRYAETDQMGIVYYGNYFTWFEIGRVELCRHLGFEYKQMESEDDSLIVVVEAHCRYKQPAKFDDLLTIRTGVTASKRRMLEFGYEIIRQGSDQTIATGRTLHVICDHQGRPKSLPEKYRKYFPVTGLTRDETLSL
jgi:acyl-CoA thioester hydrolase